VPYTLWTRTGALRFVREPGDHVVLVEGVSWTISPIAGNGGYLAASRNTTVRLQDIGELVDWLNRRRAWAEGL